ncbi:hypothetical protein [Peribacillus sp. CSMR9]|uniref:hypothetical protein n=1 Tax=Peribacillus sp. CSMR9 TaxID=2981350 RepID=UPI0029551AA8|nr:hypothetical protein [Peribacillus sp. CSMR9]MDV7764332.1 hypothetical protein [Peribacillus sp. CSMR9]
MRKWRGFMPVILFGFSFMALATVFSTYGIAAEMSHVVPGAYILALMVMLSTENGEGHSIGRFSICLRKSRLIHMPVFWWVGRY